ncbi:CDP-glycerol glycerophosphotransferase family protein [Lentilactobacillus kosonis]|uniref:CDP-glycerol:poly(Glycerophosphate) glycerophosphotransferase n=1 Tax=Lentilactobacillus kosonis TaxID=2810561 RepID=A0A401FL61_9LACO|nr:CDP-glycerol glycerophosphotransferase family protein [Lentilactobacillus kosonis]GAY73087.1 CDP-glycerol:poly(glycerophosphate) glycerophosphotransferase [Lentilactobacillus kosonis]
MGNKFKQLLKLIARLVLIVINDGFLCMPIKKRRVVFESFNGRDINDNPYAIYQELVNIDANYQDSAYFSVKPSEYRRLSVTHPEIKLIRRFTPAWAVLMATSEYWVMNSRLPLWWHKNRRTHYIQTWHGTPLKKLGRDIDNVEIPGTTTAKYHEQFQQEANRWDALIAPNQYSQDIFKSAFDFKNQFLNIGYPRNDVLYTQNRSDKVAELKQKLLGKLPNTVILYAPTWRDDDYKQKGVYNFELPFDLKDFFTEVGDDTQLIIRPHYLVKDKINISGYEDRVTVLADNDINELYLIADLLITDYSSVMFDYANLKRPTLFYAYDLEHYRDELRGFYFNYQADNLSGPLVTTRIELSKKLAEFKKYRQFPGYEQHMNKFNDQFCAWETGQASSKVAQLILNGGK